MVRGLYLHIPFCRSKCYYCDFVSSANPSNQMRQQFFQSLLEEVRSIAGQRGRLSFETLYLGGGTPSSLSIAEMNEIFQILRGYFTVNENAEITCEVNPGDQERMKFEAYRGLGINRISLGAQAFQDSLLQALGRRHLTADIYRTAEAVRHAGFSNMSVDLMLKLPGQTAEDFRNSLECAAALQSEQITLYDLDVHPKTRFGIMQGKGELTLPGEEDHFRMLEHAENFLSSAGYRHYELTSFARPGFESRHNLIYWHNQEYLGLGPGAFSYLDGVRYQFASNVAEYFTKCSARDWRNAVEYRLNGRERETETAMTGLRLDEGVSIQSFLEIRSQLEERLPALIAEGMILRTGERIVLTRKGRFVADHVFEWLFKP